MIKLRKIPVKKEKENSAHNQKKQEQRHRKNK